MSDGGKALEKLVRQIEELLLPNGFTVKGNNRIYNDNGVQIAEFDVEIRGKLGSTDIAWLIECRDRPGGGAVPGSWIEQLVGRRDRFKFNKVTAVSTTGFADAAAEYAKASGIELRTVKKVTAEDVASWLRLRHIHQLRRVTRLNASQLLISPKEPHEIVKALENKIKSIGGNTKILKSTETGESVTAAAAFHVVVTSVEGLLDSVQPNEPLRPVRIRASYPKDDSHYVVETDLGSVRITEILFEGELFAEETLVPIESIQEYSIDQSGERISQTVTFPLEIQGMQFSIEMHNLAESGETHVLLRRL
jgi:restriction endonuclease